MIRTAKLLHRLAEALESVRCGEGVLTRMKIFLVLLLVLPFLSGSIKHMFCTLSSREKEPRVMIMYRSILNSLCAGMRVNVGGVRYILEDYENLVVLPFYGCWMWDYLKPQNGEFFLDVGAHVGKYALQVAKIVGEDGAVVAIESDSENYAILKRNIKANRVRNVVAVNMAAWHCDTTLRFFLFRSSLGKSVKIDFGLGSTEVEARALDNVLREMNVDRVDWIKINVEGAELETLKGLENTLKNFHPNVIAEVGDDCAEEVAAFMSEMGYVMRKIPEAHGQDFSYYIASHLPERVLIE